MATRDELLKALAKAAEYPVEEEEAVEVEEPIPVLVSDLGKLSVHDLPGGVHIEPVDKIEPGTIYPTFNGRCALGRGKETPALATLEVWGWRPGWRSPLGMDEYHQLVRRAIEARQRFQGDVELLDFFDDGHETVTVEFTIRIPETNLRKAVDHARLVESEVLEAAEAAAAGVLDLFDSVSKRLEGWGSDPLDVLVDRMSVGTANEKGRTLEELTTRLFARVPGFTATGRMLTETEEIDISIQNGSDDELWRRESFLLLAECKNWSGKCGKNEFVVFERKLENRTGRVSCGFLVSWNGFADTVSAEMLRGTKGNILVVPVTGADLRGAVRDGAFPSRLKQLYRDAVYL